MSQDQILCVSYIDQGIGPSQLYCSEPLTDVVGAPDLDRILAFIEEEGKFIFAYRKYQTVNHLFYIESKFAKDMLMITFMIKTAIFKNDIAGIFKYLDSKTPILEDFAEDIKKLNSLTSLLQLKKVQYPYRDMKNSNILNLADEKLKASFLEIYARYFQRLNQDYSLGMFSPQLNQTEILQKLDSLVNKFSKQLELKESELRLKERELELKEEQLTNIYTVEGLPDVKRNIVIFVSYATKDADLFKIKELAENLTSYEKIDDVLYWQEDLKDNIITYMSDNLDKCDVMLLFCSPNALKSKPIEKEWTSADMMNKPIIPVFIKTDHIPPLLKSRLGVEFDTFDLKKTIDEIYEIILKKVKQRIIEIKDLRTDF